MRMGWSQTAPWAFRLPGMHFDVLWPWHSEVFVLCASVQRVCAVDILDCGTFFVQKRMCNMLCDDKWPDLQKDAKVFNHHLSQNGFPAVRPNGSGAGWMSWW